jgi:Tfp pilus assembly protein PilV
MSRLRQHSRRVALQDESGFTLIEVLAAIVLIIIGVFATAATLTHSRTATNSSERIETMAHLAQNEMENLLGSSYASVGMTTLDMSTIAGSGSGQAWDPANFVNNTATKTFSYDFQNSSLKEPFVTTASDSSCTCLTPYKDAATGRYSLTVWRFITWVDDTCATCPGTQNYKRITIVVTSPFSGGSPTHAPYILSTVRQP